MHVRVKSLVKLPTGKNRMAREKMSYKYKYTGEREKRDDKKNRLKTKERKVRNIEEYQT